MPTHERVLNDRAAAIPLSGRSIAAIVATSLVGLLAFLWPMLAARGSEILAHATDAPLIFGLLVPLLLAVTLSLVAEGAMGAKAVALLGVLAATAAALRALGAGIAGLEPIWIVIVLGAYALGAGFGFVLGAVCLVASALLTGGVGPWLPFQMIGAAWVGLAAGLLAGRLPARGERWWLACFSAVAAILYGWLLNLWFWPTLTGLPEPISFVPGADADHQRAALGAVQPHDQHGLRPAAGGADLRGVGLAGATRAGVAAPCEPAGGVRRAPRVRRGALMRVQLLGTGSADRWPNPWCRCASCEWARSTGSLRDRTSALVDDILLVDPGPDAGGRGVDLSARPDRPDHA